MPKEKTTQLKCIDHLRHMEYYGMQDTFDSLYAKSKAGEIFTNLMDIILSRENILLAYRNIKSNAGSRTPGTDQVIIDDIGKLPPEIVVEKVRYFVAGSRHGYRPKPVRRKDIPKPDGSTRPLGVPCIWDRLIQQCIRQVVEPICEAKFSENSYGYRPNRSAEHAIASVYKNLQRSGLYFVVEFDIKGFFDNVNHSKLIKQIWAMGIRDKHLIWILKQILKAPVRLPDGSTICPTKGTTQGGIISPLLANIVLNELDRWVESQWENHPITAKYSQMMNSNGRANKGNGYKAMKKTRLKEMRIVRYADDFRIFCRTKDEAEKVKRAVTQWLEERLKLEVSEEKTKVVDVRRKYSEFLGFKIRVHLKGGKYVVESRICDKGYKRAEDTLVRQAKKIATPEPGRKNTDELRRYNSMVLGVQNYYRIATNINLDCDAMNRRIMAVLTNRLSRERVSQLRKTGRKLSPAENKRYGKSKMVRYLAGTDEPIYPIGCVQHKNPMHLKASVNNFTQEGRREIHDNLRINVSLMRKLMEQPQFERSVEYADNRISLFSEQWGKCAVTGRDFKVVEDIHCHHKIPRSQGGSDEYSNLALILEPVHVLIHAKREDTISAYAEMLKLDKVQVAKINAYRRMANNKEIRTTKSL